MVGPRSHGPRCRSTRPGITLLGRPLAANGRCSDGMSTPAARRDQDARSARRLGYVNTCRLRLMKPIPTGIDGRAPGLTGRRPAENEPAGRGPYRCQRRPSEPPQPGNPKRASQPKHRAARRTIIPHLDKARDTSSILCQGSRSRNPHRYLLLLRNFQPLVHSMSFTRCPPNIYGLPFPVFAR